MTANLLDTLTILTLAATFGGMAFFGFVMAPLIFSKLPMDTAGGFIRQVFPVYYLVMAITTGIAALLSLFGHAWLGVILVLTSAGFIVARQALMPTINRLRDAELQGDTAAGPRFNRLHRASVWLNGAQFLAVTGSLVWLAWAS